MTKDLRRRRGSRAHVRGQTPTMAGGDALSTSLLRTSRAGQGSPSHVGVMARRVASAAAPACGPLGSRGFVGLAASRSAGVRRPSWSPLRSDDYPVELVRDLGGKLALGTCEARPVLRVV